MKTKYEQERQVVHSGIEQGTRGRSHEARVSRLHWAMSGIRGKASSFLNNNLMSIDPTDTTVWILSSGHLCHQCSRRGSRGLDIVS